MGWAGGPRPIGEGRGADREEARYCVFYSADAIRSIVMHCRSFMFLLLHYIAIRFVV